MTVGECLWEQSGRSDEFNVTRNNSYFLLIQEVVLFLGYEIVFEEKDLTKT